MIWIVAYAASIVAANVLITVFGIVPILGFGLMAPAGVYAVGLSFWLRDQVHEAVGPRWTIVAILAGAALSAFLSPALALASGTAFLVSELADLAIYAPLRARRRMLAVVASNLVGSVVDSAVFLVLAFGSLDFLAGQVIGKWLMVLPVVIGMMIVRWQRRPMAAVA